MTDGHQRGITRRCRVAVGAAVRDQLNHTGIAVVIQQVRGSRLRVGQRGTRITKTGRIGIRKHGGLRIRTQTRAGGPGGVDRLGTGTKADCAIVGGKAHISVRHAQCRHGHRLRGCGHIALCRGSRHRHGGRSVQRHIQGRDVKAPVTG